MEKFIKIFMTGAALLLLGSGVAAAQQVQLQGSLIPQFVEPLPFLTEFEIVNATSTGQNEAPFDVNAEEFQSQILPTPTNWPTAPATCMVNDPDPWGGAANAGAVAGTASWTYGYLSGIANAPGLIRQTYLGPIVIAERGVDANPTYGNNIPLASPGFMGVVQFNMPIDKTLDWADPLETTGPASCLPVLNPANGLYEYTNGDCGKFYPFYDGPMPIATHLHGGEVAPAYDGGPDAWFTQGAAIRGSGYPGATYNYPNEQQEGLIWFHDHALGMTRLNVFAGLAGIQPILDPDPANAPLTTLPQLGTNYSVPLIIQDRTFDTNCEIYYNLASNPQPNPTVHPFWIPEFIGDTIVVNGKTWPFFNVEPRQYRLSFVNGSNSRFYELTLKSVDDPVTGYMGAYLPMLVIATDDGYLMNAVSTGNKPLIIGPGERYEVIVDFKVDLNGFPVPANNNITMYNSARTPYPGGGAVVNKLTDRVMQFRVNLSLDESVVADTAVVNGSPLRDPVMNPIYPIADAHAADPNSITRQLTLNEAEGAGGPLELVINNSKLNLKLNTPGCNTAVCRETEIPAVGDTEIWEIINISADAHPMHLHLTSFQVLSRQAFQASRYMAAYTAALVANNKLDGEGPPYTYNVENLDGAIGGNPAVGPYLRGKPKAPNAYEMGWKDTVIAYPGEVTRIAVRWAPTDLPAIGTDPNTGRSAPVVGTNSYVVFDPTQLEGDNVGYVWHCHIVDHEDNEMMRNYTVGAGTPANPTGRQPTTPGGGF
jgi:FtsP/CotA-like multicopper oxidase with cupredoxin domain